MSGAEVLEDASALSGIDRHLHVLERWLNTASGLVILLLVLLASANVFGRKLLNAPLPGFVDMVEQCMAIFAFAGLAYCQRQGGHIRMDVLVSNVAGRRKWLLEAITSAIALIVISALIYGSYHHFLRSFDINAPLWSRDSSIDISIPLWPAKLVVPVALTLLWLRFAVQLAGFLSAFVTGSSRPVAVPLDLDISRQSLQSAPKTAEPDA